MLFGTDDLWKSNEDIIKDISFLSVGVKKNLVNTCYSMKLRWY